VVGRWLSWISWTFPRAPLNFSGNSLEPFRLHFVGGVSGTDGRRCHVHPEEVGV
jgi:hypothetical protein